MSFSKNNRGFKDKNQASQQVYTGQYRHSGQSWVQDPHALVTNYDLGPKEFKNKKISLSWFLTLGSLSQRGFTYKCKNKTTSHFINWFFFPPHIKVEHIFM